MLTSLLSWLSINSLFRLLVFFTASLLIFHGVPSRRRWIVLLVASYWFYISNEPRFWPLIIIQTFIVYWLALAIQRNERVGQRRVLLTLGISALVGPLLWGKLSRGTMAPLGISFYTFQGLSYLIDVYWSRIQAERHLGYVATYKAFFPQLIAGPIEKAENLIPQIKQPAARDWALVQSGLRTLLYGLFKKYAIANNLAVFVDAVFSFPDTYKGLPVILGVVLVRYQIYCDFSGYTDIARGVAKTFGIRLGPNFDRPFAAVSIADYWRRWHISLVSWFRDYVYFPLCRWHSGPAALRLNLFVIMFFVGIWHEISFGWMLFGVVNAAMMIVASFTGGLRARLWGRLDGTPFERLVGPAKIILTFVLTCIPGLMTRATHWSSLKQLFRNLLGDHSVSWFNWGAFAQFLSMNQIPVIGGATLVFIIVMEWAQYWWSQRGEEGWLRLNRVWRYGWLCAVWCALLVFANLDQPWFVYVRF